MAKHITLEEAAAQLDMSVEEFKRRLKTDRLFEPLERGKIRDGTSFRFNEATVEEVGRQLGASSGTDNPLPTIAGSPMHDSDDFKVEPTAETKPAPADEPLKFAAEDSDDVFPLAADEPAAPEKKKPGSDSDLRLEGGSSKSPAGDKGETVPTEEIALDFGSSSSAVIKGGSSAKLSAPKSSGKLTSDSGKGLDQPGTGDSSEFELSLDAGDSSDFDINLNADQSDEVDLGEMPKDAPGGSGRRSGEKSGILSRKPNDSGRSLEKGKEDKSKEESGKGSGPKIDTDSDSDLDFELTLDSSAAVSGTKLGDLSGKKVTADSDSEFELTLDDSGDSGLEHAAIAEAESEKGDIFETDFEIPPMDDSASEQVTPDSTDVGDDVELPVAEVGEDDGTEVSDSEAVLLEAEESAPKAKAKSKKKPVVEEDESDVDLAEVEVEDDEEGSAASALKGVKSRRRHDDDEDEEEEAVPAGAYRPVPWGIFPILFLFPAFIFTLLGGIMGFELLQTMWGYQQPQQPQATLTRGIASQLDMDPKDQ